VVKASDRKRGKKISNLNENAVQQKNLTKRCRDNVSGQSRDGNTRSRIDEGGSAETQNLESNHHPVSVKGGHAKRLAE